MMQKYEITAPSVIKLKIRIRYADDKFVIMEINELKSTHKLIIKISDDVKFTRESEEENYLLFLDVLVNRINTGSLETQIYRKPGHMDQMLKDN
ncbi:hypothetical protein Smp_072250 [Schistosoma mansoni]|uniref:hypothetical protein n=1 Tax=Schistosoma mansoni TaxID=6183 RepID=UPI0001A61B4D|nr:hypothetical protein Smp_072250 [Schistosoma mansoni]|eukprot:XP_018649155.1 hypothetical protein Smp_072250 [Schistosoma mansoni]